MLTGPDLPAAHDALPLETSVPGVFAAGAIWHGSVKRVASAVGDGGWVREFCHGVTGCDILFQPWYVFAAVDAIRASYPLGALGRDTGA